MGDYLYTPLTQRDSIRLIQLRPSTDKTALLECELIETTLQRAESEIIDHYTALSYVWGDPTKSTRILVNGKPTFVTRSLDCALRHVRDAYRTMMVWADGICINQNDDTEKSHQVQQMAKIYLTANHTVIFLGESDPQTEAILQRYQSFVPDRNSPFHEQAVAMFRELERSPWFNRVWIFQELVMSRDPRVQYGNLLFTWDFLCQITNSPTPRSPGLIIAEMQKARAFYQLSHFSLKYPGIVNTDTIPILNRNNLVFGDDKKTRLFGNFLDILVSRRGFGVSDPRDMIFAHVGLVQSIDVDVNYKRTVGEIYETFARDHIEATQTFEIFSHIEDIELADRRQDIASWAPDWTTHVTSPPSRIMDFTGSDFHFISPKNVGRHDNIPSELFWGYDTFWHVEKGVLSCDAFRLSSIQHISRVLDSGIAYGECPEAIQVKDETAESEAEEWFAECYNWWRNTLGSDQEVLHALSKDSYRTPARKPSVWKQKLGISKPPELPNTSRPKIKMSNLDDLRFSKDGQKCEAPYVFDYLRLRGDKTWRKGSGRIVDGRRLARVKSGQLALVPASTKPGDHIYFFRSCPVPFIVRRIVNEEGLRPGKSLAGANSQNALSNRMSTLSDGKQKPLVHVKIVGECFVDGVMFGRKDKTGLLHTITADGGVILAVH